MHVYMISNNPAVHDDKDPGTQLNTKLAPKSIILIHIDTRTMKPHGTMIIQ